MDSDVVALAAACPPGSRRPGAARGSSRTSPTPCCRRRWSTAAKGYFPVRALRHLDEPYLTTVRDALCAPEAKERALLCTDHVQGLLERPDEARKRTGANSLWVLAVLEIWLQQHDVG